MSEMTITYDWEASRWASFPLGIKLSKLVKLDGVPVKFNGQYEHNFDDEIEPETTFRVGVKVLFPI